MTCTYVWTHTNAPTPSLSLTNSSTLLCIVLKLRHDVYFIPCHLKNKHLEKQKPLPTYAEEQKAACNRTAIRYRSFLLILFFFLFTHFIYFLFISLAEIWLKGLSLFVDMQLHSIKWTGDSCTSTVEHRDTANYTVLSLSFLHKCTWISVVFDCKHQIILGHERVRFSLTFRCHYRSLYIF